MNAPAVDKRALAGNEMAWPRLGRTTVLICAFAGAVDSFDTQMIGFTGRLVAVGLAFPVAQLGWIFAASQLGGVVGALTFGRLADRFGRSRMLVIASLIAAAFTAASLTAQTFGAFLLFRVLTGLGLGGVMPCFLSLGVEAMPSRLRIGLTPVLYACFPVGGILGAWISAPVIVAYGWRGVFVMGAASFILIAILVAVLPLAEQPATRSPQRAGAAALLSQGQAGVTLWLWGLFLLAPAGVYLLALWMPSLIQLVGVTAARSGVLVGFLNVGGLIGAGVGGWALVRVGRLPVLGTLLVSGTLGFSLIGAVHAHWAALIAASMLSGAAVAGAMSLLVSLAANAYPTELRATGLGWAMGIARIGQMAAPLPIGLLLGRGVAPLLVLAACGVPTLAALIPLYGVDRALNARKMRAAPSPA